MLALEHNYKKTGHNVSLSVLGAFCVGDLKVIACSKATKLNFGGSSVRDVCEKLTQLVKVLFCFY